MNENQPHRKVRHAELVAGVKRHMAIVRSEASPKAMTAEELMEELRYARLEEETDAEYVARVLAIEGDIRQAREAYANAAEGLLKDLAAAGFVVSSLHELRHKRVVYKAAIPALLRWLPKVTYTPLKDDIIRTLAVPWAKPDAVPVLLREFRTISDPTGEGLRWVVGNSLEALADDSVFDDMVELIKDKSYGRAREMLVLGLAKMKNPRAIKVLIGLLEDEEVVGHAVIALGKLRASEARSRIESLLNHPKAWIRKEAKKALAKIDKRPRK